MPYMTLLFYLKGSPAVSVEGVCQGDSHKESRGLKEPTEDPGQCPLAGTDQLHSHHKARALGSGQGSADYTPAKKIKDKNKDPQNVILAK